MGTVAADIVAATVIITVAAIAAVAEDSGCRPQYGGMGVSPGHGGASIPADIQD